MIMLNGNRLPLTISSIVAYISVIKPSVIISKMLYFWFFYETFILSVISFTKSSKDAKLVGPFRTVFSIAFLYAYSTPFIPSHSGLKISPFNAKQCSVTLHIYAPNPKAGIYLSES